MFSILVMAAALGSEPSVPTPGPQPLALRTEIRPHLRLATAGLVTLGVGSAVPVMGMPIPSIQVPALLAAAPMALPGDIMTSVALRRSATVLGRHGYTVDRAALRVGDAMVGIGFATGVAGMIGFFTFRTGETTAPLIVTMLGGAIVQHLAIIPYTQQYAATIRAVDQLDPAGEVATWEPKRSFFAVQPTVSLGGIGLQGRF